MSSYFPPPQQHTDLMRAALRVIDADHYAHETDPHADAESEYASELLALAARALATAVDAKAPDEQPVNWVAANTVVYRAVWNTTPLGLYSNPDAARAHCIGDAENNGETGTPVWLPLSGEDDDEMAERQLYLSTDDGTPHGSRNQTEYSVLPLDLLDAYDPEAEG